jgi:hypothetical protein
MFGMSVETVPVLGNSPRLRINPNMATASSGPNVVCGVARHRAHPQPTAIDAHAALLAWRHQGAGKSGNSTQEDRSLITEKSAGKLQTSIID